jgi:hypothetical protein
MKTSVFCTVLLLSAISTTAAFADEGNTSTKAPNVAARKTPAKRKPAKAEPEEKLAPSTEAAAPQTPEPTPIALAPLPAAPPAAPAAPIAPATNPERAETTASSDSATRLEAVFGRTQAFGFAAGVRAGHRMSNNVYVGGSAMVQTGLDGAIVTYQAAELGYDAKLGDARFMPYVGLGPMIAIPTETDDKILITPVAYPGFTLRYENDKSAFTAGADVRFLYLTEADQAAFALNVTTGIKF